ncbi:MAG TPA: nucleotidyltransferase domain-containing protein [Thermoanaerobaculia bacterium]|nr:nucleotidyltransferase domain-containing protein [Thermoanaerobaculia bacterium]
MESLDREILSRVESIPGIAALLVFGSRAAGTPRPDSDLDVAVIPAVDDPTSRRKLQTSLAVALAELAPEGRVDVVLLDESPELLRQRIFETGRLLLCRDRVALRDLRVRTMREHADRAFYRDMMREAQQRRLERGDFGGRSGRAVESLRRLGKLSR